MTRICSLAALTVLELSAAERVRCAAQAGYTHVGVRLLRATPEEAACDLIDDPTAMKALAAALADTGVGVFDVEILRLQPTTPVASFTRVLEAAAALGGRELLVAGNNPDRSHTIEQFAELCERAAPFGLGVNLEFMPWTDVPHLAAAREVVARAARPNGAVLVDAFHWSRSHGTLAEVAATPRQHLRFAQLCDVPAAVPATLADIRAEARAERRFPGEGELDLRGLLGALPPGLPLSLEVPTQTLARSVGAVARAQRALEGTRRLLGEGTAPSARPPA